MPLKCDLLCEALQFPEEEDASCSVLPWHLLYHSTGNTCVVCIAQLVTTQAHWRGHDLLSDALCYVGPLTEKHSLSVLFVNSVAVKSFLTWPWSCFLAWLLLLMWVFLRPQRTQQTLVHRIVCLIRKTILDPSGCFFSKKTGTDSFRFLWHITTWSLFHPDCAASEHTVGYLYALEWWPLRPNGYHSLL